MKRITRKRGNRPYRAYQPVKLSTAIFLSLFWGAVLAAVIEGIVYVIYHH